MTLRETVDTDSDSKLDADSDGGDDDTEAKADVKWEFCQDFQLSKPSNNY
jgi:hypothetical protein